MNEWISVKDRLPEMYITPERNVISNIIVFRSDWTKTVHLGYVQRYAQQVRIGKKSEMLIPIYRWYDQQGSEWEDITHWMPLPEPPKEI